MMRSLILGLILIATLSLFISSYINEEQKIAIQITPNTNLYVSIQRSNIFKEMFKEPFEICYLIMFDGTIYRFTNNLDEAVVMPSITEFLNSENKSVKDIAICVHNHPFLSPPSAPDMRFFTTLLENGFIGSFIIYFPLSGTVMLLQKK